MRSTLCLTALALSATMAASPALAQYDAPAPPEPIRAVPAKPDAAAAVPAGQPPLCQAGISKDARKALVDLQSAVVAKNSATITGLVAAAQAVAKTNDDKCFIAMMQMKAAADRNDLAGIAAALEAQLASGSVPTETIVGLYDDLAHMQYNAKAFAAAGASLERSLQLRPNRGSVMQVLAETRAKENRTADALSWYQKAIDAEVAAGRKPVENWYKRPVAIAYAAKSPSIQALTRAWVAAYPSPQSWSDTIRLHGELSGLGAPARIDMYRLARINRALLSQADYGRFADVVLAKGFPGEAKAVLEEGFAAKAIDRNEPTLKAIYASAQSKSAGDRAALDGQVKSAGTAKALMTLAEAYFGYGDYTKAAALVRAAQGKAGIDAELANLRLGMALAASGDKAGAKAALDQITGPQAEVARYWQTYLATRP